jgi:hypothetical protein
LKIFRAALMAQPFGKIPQPLGQSNIGAELMKKLLLVAARNKIGPGAE